METSERPLYYRPDLFENLKEIANKNQWLESEVLWEAWIADTILLVADFLKDAVLTGGSGARNFTRVYRLTYDVDFDCKQTDIETIFTELKEANAGVGGRRNLEDTRAGLITTQEGANVVDSFRGPNRLAKFVRWTKDGSRPLKLHIMNVSNLPEMFPGELRKLQTVAVVDARVPTADRKCLFYRKAIRANKETRPEDFMDLAFILESSTNIEFSEIVSFCSSRKRKRLVSSGIQNLVVKRMDFRAQIESRLAHARPKGAMDDWIEAKGKKLREFVEVIEK